MQGTRQRTSPKVREIPRMYPDEIRPECSPHHSGRGHIFCLRGLHPQSRFNHFAGHGRGVSPTGLRVPHGGSPKLHRQNMLYLRDLHAGLHVFKPGESQELFPGIHESFCEHIWRSVLETLTPGDFHGLFHWQDGQGRLTIDASSYPLTANGSKHIVHTCTCH